MIDAVIVFLLLILAFLLGIIVALLGVAEAEKLFDDEEDHGTIDKADIQNKRKG